MALTSFMERPNYGSAQSSSPYPHGISRVPPSPPMDSSEPRISLPPISSLMQLAEAGSPTHEAPSPWHSSLFPRRSSFPATLPQHSPLNIVPLAPPVGPERLCQDPFSPGAHSSSSRASYRFETTPPLDDNFRPSPVSPHGGPLPTFFGHHASASSVHIHQQLSLPADFPPVSVVPPPNTWHGHYMSSASSSAFSHSQDRYVCSTCSKAFSRPSSLRIHNHSHTGEKPYRCSVQGCGKAFSVRSNMKRHERGCHQDGPMSPFTRSP